MHLEDWVSAESSTWQCFTCFVASSETFYQCILKGASLYTEGQERNVCEQVPVSANVCVCTPSSGKRKNLIITVIKAIIRKKTTLTQKCLSWKASQLNLLQPIKRVITIRRAPAHSCMTEFAHLRNQTHAKHEAVRKNTMLTDIAFTHLFTTWITNTQHESIWVTNKGTHIMQHACT